MRKGIRVEGRVIDRKGRPVVGFDVGTNHDLHQETLTGYGGAIFSQGTSTDSRGRFALVGVYPNTFYPTASVSEDRLPVWVRTQLRGRWISQPVYKITPRRHEQVIRLTLEVARVMPYRFRGVVVDGYGKPVAGAQIAVGVSRHDPWETYEDSHHSLHGESDENGRFDIRSASPFVTFVKVTAAGFPDYSLDFDDDVEPLREHRKWKFVLLR
jgi:hypothetical protein